MKKSHRRTVLIWTVIMAAVVFIILSVIYLLHRQDEQTQQTEKGKIENVRIDVSSYRAYKPDHLDFSFIIADVHVTSGSVQEISLSHFTTSEGIALDQTEFYENQAESAGIDIDGMGTADVLNGGSTAYDAVLFIPVKDRNAKSITVTSDIEGVSDMSFDMTKADSSTQEIEEESRKDTGVEQDNMKLTVYRMFEVDPADCTQNGEAAMLPGSARVFAAQVAVDAVDDNGVTIESALFTADNGLEVSSEDESFADSLYENAIGRTMQTGDSGYIYFIILNNGAGDVSGSGTLKLTISGRDHEVDIQTGLN